MNMRIELCFEVTISTDYAGEGARATRVWESRWLQALIKASLRNQIGLFLLLV